MFRRFFIWAVAAFVVAAVFPSSAAAGQDSAIRFVPDVEAQFNALAVRVDPLGFHIGGSPNPSTCKHYQGLARVEGPDGTPYLFVTRSGNTPDIPVLPDGVACDDSPGETGKGNLLVVRMGSRDKNGERLRSNRLRHDTTFDATAPESEDVVVTHFNFDGSGDFPNYGHPGGMQVVGHMLAVAVEYPYNDSSPSTLVMFFDVTDPEHPRKTSEFPLEEQVGEKAGLVALTPLPTGTT